MIQWDSMYIVPTRNHYDTGAWWWMIILTFYNNLQSVRIYIPIFPYIFSRSSNCTYYSFLHFQLLGYKILMEFS